MIPRSNDQDQLDGRWGSHPLLAATLRIGILACPPIAALLVALLVNSRLPSDLSLIVRVVVVSTVAVTAALVLERLLRRLLPLESLLRMTMLFPGRAPSRLAVAQMGRNRADLERRLLDPDGAGDVAAAMLALITALGRHDKRTRGHSERVRMITELLADELKLPAGDRDRLRWAALLHDIGKLDVAASILSKAGPLDDAQWAHMRQHPAHGARLAGPFLEWLGEWSGGIAHHHERFDGGGYPYGLAGEAISRAGRIVCVVDAFETMTAARSYKRASGTQHALTELTRCAGTQFDPMVVRAFLQISLPKLWWATGPLGLLVQVPVIGAAQNSAAQVTAGISTVASSGAAAAGTAAILGIGTVVVGGGAASAEPVSGTTPQVTSQSAAPSTAPAPWSSRAGGQPWDDARASSAPASPMASEAPDATPAAPAAPAATAVTAARAAPSPVPGAPGAQAPATRAAPTTARSAPAPATASAPSTAPTAPATAPAPTPPPPPAPAPAPTQPPAPAPAPAPTPPRPAPEVSPPTAAPIVTPPPAVSAPPSPPRSRPPGDGDDEDDDD